MKKAIVLDGLGIASADFGRRAAKPECIAGYCLVDMRWPSVSIPLNSHGTLPGPPGAK